MRNVFEEFALELAAYGLAVLPLGGPDGKAPTVKWRGWRSPPSRETLVALCRKHPKANIGAICHLSRVSVVDVDDPALLDTAFDRFGSTPLVTRTPRGGAHLWYRHAGERSGSLRSEGLAIDIKAKGGIIVVPPSVRPSGEFAGREYRFLQGTWADLERLPKIKPDNPASARHDAAVQEGDRNDSLFRSLLRNAKDCSELNELLDFARALNATYSPPLPEKEVEKVALNSWSYHTDGRNFLVQGGTGLTTPEFELLAPKPDALTLYLLIKFKHWDRPEFALSAKAMAKQQAIRGWSSHTRYMKARQHLLELGFIDELHKGGAGKGDPSLFGLSKSWQTLQGSHFSTQYNQTPLSLLDQGPHSKD